MAQIDLGKRLASMVLDHFSMSMILVLPFSIVSLINFSDNKIGFNPVIQILFLTLMMLVYLNKDFVNGRSFAKRLIGFKIVNARTNENATDLQCYIRNMTIPLWPIEVAFTLFSPSRRLGDLIANTKVIQAEKATPKSLITELKLKKFNSTSIITILVGIAYTACFWYLFELTMLN